MRESIYPIDPCSSARLMGIRLNMENTQYLGMGAAVLSAGGGSYPYIEYLGTRELLEDRPPANLVLPETLADDAHVALVAMVGAPLPMFERFVDPAHFARPVGVLARHISGQA